MKYMYLSILRMDFRSDKYTLDKCSICGKHTALKNGVCNDCEEKGDMPDFIRDLFGKDKNEK